MPDLMHSRQALIIAVDVAAGQAAGQDVAAVLVVVLARGGRRDPGGGQGAVAEEQGAGGAAGGGGRGREVGLQVDVQVGVGAVAQGALHACVVGVGGPGVVHAEVHAAEAEEDLVGVVGV